MKPGCTAGLPSLRIEMCGGPNNCVKISPTSRSKEGSPKRLGAASAGSKSPPKRKKQSSPRLTSHEFSSTAVEVGYKVIQEDTRELFSALRASWAEYCMHHGDIPQIDVPTNESGLHVPPGSNYNKSLVNWESIHRMLWTAEGASEQDSEDADDSKDNFRECLASLAIPACPIATEFHLGSAEVRVCEHLSQQQGGVKRGIVIFIPGVNGERYDETRNFDTAARELSQAEYAAIDCYRISWSRTSTSDEKAVESVIEVLCHGIRHSSRGFSKDAKLDLSICMVGYSFGGKIAIQSADLVANTFQRADNEFPSFSNVGISGVCTINSSTSCNLPESTQKVFDSLPIANKINMVLPGGNQDLLCSHRIEVVGLLSEFVSTAFRVER
jgi:hypothetical protein